MDTVVVDTNKVFSALLKPSAIREVLFSSAYRFVAPNFISVEIFKHYPKILRYSIHSPEEIIELYKRLTDHIEFIAPSKISLEHRQKAYELTQEVDLKDLIYVALALEVGGKIWTGDVKLQAGLRQRGFDHFFEPLS